MVLHLVLETMIVEIGKGVQQGLLYPFHPLRVVSRASSSPGSKRKRRWRIAALRTCSVSLSRRRWRAGRRLKSRSRRSGADLPAPSHSEPRNMAAWESRGRPQNQMPPVSSLAYRPKALALSKLNQEPRSWWGRRWRGTRTAIANVLVRRLEHSRLRLRRSRLKPRVSGFPSPARSRPRPCHAKRRATQQSPTTLCPATIASR